MRVSEFLDATPREILALLAGFHRRHDYGLYMMSVLAGWIAAPHVKKPISPTKFYRPQHFGHDSIDELERFLARNKAKKGAT